MQKSNNFFFSKILYHNIQNFPDTILGKLNDVILDFSYPMPVIKAIQVRSGRRTFYISAESLEIYNDDNSNFVISLNTNSIHLLTIDENEFFLARDFLDKQIVDINGKKVERVNDVRIGNIQGNWSIIAVDIGLRGLLRRLGVEYSAIRVSHLLKKEFRNTLVHWDNVQTLSGGTSNLQLQTSMNKLRTLHAADIADIIEDLDKQNQITLFQGLDDEKAAEVLEEMETESQLDILETLPDEKASDLLEIMPSDEAADILEEIEDARAKILLDQMEAEASSEILELMEYEEETVGSVMAKDYLAFLPDMTVENVLFQLKQEKPEEETSHYLFLTNSSNKLIGMVSLLDLITSEHEDKLYDLMTEHPRSVNDNDDIEKVLKIMEKYNLLVLPVINEKKELVGITSLNDLINEFIRLRRSSL